MIYRLVLELCQFLDSILNVGIFLLAIVELIFTIISAINLEKLSKKIDYLNNPKLKNGKSFWKRKGEIQTSHPDTVKKWSDLEDFMKEYQKKIQIYTGFTLVIQLFTLLGILGTVAGLFVAMQDMETAENLFEGVKFALSSTVLGISFALIFKIADIVFSAVYVSHIDEGIEIYEKDYNIHSSDAFHDMLEKMTENHENLEE